MALRHTLNVKLDALFTFHILCTISFLVLFLLCALAWKINTDIFSITMTLRRFAECLGNPRELLPVVRK
ncbi:CLUMA_CG019379, isoform A [Clunio marinus]|uniref:CLUMA_CG019379, isoform A n=1 Tax=Clunio marinus TaxID=568069 RepID=A0A1J1J166_9DIPT|nr:CLUMA_CG019379, isoform A [Clunio marinus]